MMKTTTGPFRFVLAGMALLAVGFLLIQTLRQVGQDFTPPSDPNATIGKPLPEMELPPLYAGGKPFATGAQKGHLAILHFFASWCVPCEAEHPLLKRLAVSDTVFVGINYKDKPLQALRFLSKFGNPYHIVVSDSDGRAGVSLAVSGVPVTFVIDQHGIIRLSEPGPLTQELVDRDILPLLKRLHETRQQPLRLP